MRAHFTSLAILLGCAVSACSDDPAQDSGSRRGNAGQSSAGGSSGAGTGFGGSAGGVARSIGGAAGSGTAVVGSAGQANVNAGCPPWPLGKLFPTIGPFFYGPHVGPCSMTTATESWQYEYNAAGQLTRQALSDDSVVITFVYEQGRLIQESRTNESGITSTTYSYLGSEVTYTSTTPNGFTESYAYTLDPQGYPLTTLVRNASAASTNPAYYRYVYENCRLARRLGYSAQHVELPAFAAEYQYDAAGHLTHRTTATRDEVYDYSCW